MKKKYVEIKLWRFIFLIILLMLAMLGVIYRFLQLNIFERHFLLRQSNARIMRTVAISAHRGMIVDRNGEPLAISTPVDSVWINPHIFHANSYQLKKLSFILGLNVAYIKKQDAIKNKEFIYLKRRISPSYTKKIKKLKIDGLYFQREYRRYYPQSNVTAHILGFTNIDDEGQEGLELAYNKWLGGIPGKKEVLKDRLGHIIANIAEIKKPIQGKNLILTIDERIQYLAYHALKDQVEKYHAASGSVVVLNARTGDILAMVNQPSYNPNKRLRSDVAAYRNRAMTDIFEPGSTIKPFNVSLALMSGHYQPSSIINTNPGRMVIDGHTIRDDGLNYGKITLTQLLQKSSNIGAAKLLLSLDPSHYSDLLRKLGFGEKTATGFPGESAGYVPDHYKWRKLDVATMAFGYGISVTTLQLAQAYAVLADYGNLQPLSLILRNHLLASHVVMPEAIAKKIIYMMRSVVEKGGTGTRAKVPGYTIAGKTGTAYIAGKNGYNKKKYMASFVGIAPATAPILVVAVTIRDPKKQHFGGVVAAPVFAKVMSGSLRILNIAPDALDNKKTISRGMMVVAPKKVYHH